MYHCGAQQPDHGRNQQVWQEVGEARCEGLHGCPKVLDIDAWVELNDFGLCSYFGFHVAYPLTDRLTSSQLVPSYFKTMVSLALLVKLAPPASRMFPVPPPLWRTVQLASRKRR